MVPEYVEQLQRLADALERIAQVVEDVIGVWGRPEPPPNPDEEADPWDGTPNEERYKGKL